MAHRKAESVLPEPVGATTTQWWPELIASHAPSCAVVGALKLLRNHSAVAGEKRSSTSARLLVAIGPSLPPGTDTRRAARSDGCGDLPLERLEHRRLLLRTQRRRAVEPVDERVVVHLSVTHDVVAPQ